MPGRRLGLLAPLAALLPGCRPALPAQSFVEPTTGRPYRVVVRPGHDAARPAAALFVLHAYANAPDGFFRGMHLDRAAVSDRGWIAVLPEGTPDARGNLAWNAAVACCGFGPRKADDLAYLHAVLADVRRRFAVDSARVFAVGSSNGGFMAHRWACAPQGDLRGIVSISGAAPGPDDLPCTPAVPVSVLEVHGTRDPIIRYLGGSRGPGARYSSAEETFAAWRQAQGCAGEPAVADERLLLFRERVRKQVAACPRARVALWTVEGGWHEMPRLRFEVDGMLGFLEGR